MKQQLQYSTYLYALICGVEVACQGFHNLARRVGCHDEGVVQRHLVAGCHRQFILALWQGAGLLLCRHLRGAEGGRWSNHQQTVIGAGKGLRF